MEITLHSYTIREVVAGFEDKGEEGVVGFGGRLNIRPKFQREFIYGDRARSAVIASIFKGFPLNVMYWVENADGTYDLLDGQQRTLSICTYYVGEFFLDVAGSLHNYPSLSAEHKEQFLSYPLQIYICAHGTSQERLDWFRTINIAGATLTDQELRNAIYAGPWVTAAKRLFSKSSCVAYNLAEGYMAGSPLRQDYLEKVLTWCAQKDGIASVEEYMGTHQFDSSAEREWQYFQQVIAWIKILFPNYRKEMKGLPWGQFYNKYKNNDYSSSALEQRIQQLFLDDDVTNNKGIYEYVLSGNERCLNIRAFSDKMKRAAYERQQGVCPCCKQRFPIEQMEGDHILPWSKGGPTTAENCQMLCRKCNKQMSNH